jgi:hypothetical protein
VLLQDGENRMLIRRTWHASNSAMASIYFFGVTSMVLNKLVVAALESH